MGSAAGPREPTTTPEDAAVETSEGPGGADGEPPARPLRTPPARPEQGSGTRGRRQLPGLLRASHPKQAVVLALVVGVLVLLTRDDSVAQALTSAAAVLVAQLLLGLVNDVRDVDLDRASGVEGKPVAAGVVPAGNASYVALVLLLLLVPLSLQNGIVAGLCLLATVVVGYAHDRWLHRTPLSPVGWAATFALLAFFVTYGGRGTASEGSAPLPSFVLLCAALGICVHFLTSLPDLVADNQARVRHLPLRVALHTGAPRLLVLSIAATVVVVAALVVTVAQAGAIAR